jgi:uncharacterized membrane protein YbhN (UPF0104 family)
VLHGTSATLFEQMFDMLVALFCAPAMLLEVFARVSPAVWFLSTVLAVMLGSLFARLFAGLLLTILRRFRGMTSRAFRGVHSLIDLVEQLRILESSLIWRLCALSAVRYGALVGSAYAVILAADLPIAMWQIAVAMPLVVLAALLSFVPGGLGINEWSYASVLIALGVPFPIAAQFALVNRILNFTGAVVVSAVGAVILLATANKPRS